MNKKTNAYRIRSISDKDLIELLVYEIKCSGCNAENCDEDFCKNLMWEWLESPYEHNRRANFMSNSRKKNEVEDGEVKEDERVVEKVKCMNCAFYAHPGRGKCYSRCTLDDKPTYALFSCDLGEREEP